MYLLLTSGGAVPYLAANAATPVAAIYLGRIPDSGNPDHKFLMKMLGLESLFWAFVPLCSSQSVQLAAGRDELQDCHVFWIPAAAGFGLHHGHTWKEIFGGFLQVGNVPVQRPRTPTATAGSIRRGLGMATAGWTSRTRAARENAGYQRRRQARRGRSDRNGQADALVDVDLNQMANRGRSWPDLDGDCRAMSPSTCRPRPTSLPDRQVGQQRRRPAGLKFLDYDGDGIRDGDNIQNVFVSLWRGEGAAASGLSMIAFLCRVRRHRRIGGYRTRPPATTTPATRAGGWGITWGRSPA